MAPAEAATIANGEGDPTSGDPPIRWSTPA
jgi:hypothetical protein